VNNGIKIHAALSIPRHEPQTHSLAALHFTFSSAGTFLQQLVSTSVNILILV